MRSASAAMTAHLTQEVTTLTTLIYIRRQDSVTYRFTTHDRSLSYNGFTWQADYGISHSALEFRISMSVANLEFGGFIDALGISEHDLVGRLFDRAEIRFYIVNWADLTMGEIKTIRGWFGNVTREGNKFSVEARSLMQALQETIGSLISDRCRSDFGDIGIGADRGCNYPIDPPLWTANTVYGSQPVGTGAILAALPNGSGDWDGGISGTKNLALVSGGTGYSNDVVVTAHAIMNDGSSWTLESINVIVANGVITQVEFPPTEEGNKPGHREITFAFSDTGYTNTIVSPTVENGFNYQLVSPGTSGATEPIWPTTIGNTVTDGTAVWKTIQGAAHSATIFSIDDPPRQHFFLDFVTSVFNVETGLPNTVTGSGAILEALPNGAGNWDGGDSSNNVDIVQGGANYSSPVVKAIFVNPLTEATETFTAIQVGLSSSGSITYVEFAPTVENEKPVSSEVTFVITDAASGVTDSEGGFFDSGTITAVTGENAGITVDIRLFNEDWEIETFAPFPFDFQIGDQVLLRIGCDHTWDMCKNRYHNQLNFRGEPNIPGNDVLFRINTNL